MLVIVILTIHIAHVSYNTLCLDNESHSEDEDNLYVYPRSKRRVSTLQTVNNVLNYAPYMPPQEEKRIRGIIQRAKRTRNGEEIAGREIVFTNIEPIRTDTEPTMMNSPGVALNARVSFTLK